MGNITLDFRRGISPDDIKKLKGIAGDMEAGKELSIIIDRTDAHEADEITRILRENNFDYRTKGGHKDEFYIKGRKL